MKIKPFIGMIGVKQQSGAVLMISLIVLLLLTMMSATSAQVTALEERMSSNMLDENLAFQSAETALVVIEKTLISGNVIPTFSSAGTGGFYSTASTIPTSAAILTDTFWTSHPVATASVASLGNGIIAPSYIVQVMAPACFAVACTSFSIPYKITVRATGATTNAVVILQSVYSPT